MKNTVPLLLGLFFFNACTTGNLEGSMDEYCSCMQEANKGKLEKVKCVELLSDIQEEYGFDPESSDYIITRLKECTSD